MSVSDIDIWRSANMLIQQHGEKAWAEAVSKYFEMGRLGDKEGRKVWRRIAKAISALTTRFPGETQH